MKKVKITAIRRADYRDLQALYENPIEHTCDVLEGQTWVSQEGMKPEGDFYDGWMKNPHSAMISCNDGFRPVSFLLETVEE